MAWLGLSQRSARLGVREPGGGPPWWKEVFLEQISVSCKWALISIHGAGVNWFHVVWMMSLTCGGAELGSAGEATERSGSASIWHFHIILWMPTSDIFTLSTTSDIFTFTCAFVLQHFMFPLLLSPLLFTFFFRIPHHWIYNLHLWLCVATFHLVLSLLQHCRL